MSHSVALVNCRRQVRDGIGRAGHLEDDLTTFAPGTLAFLTGADELSALLEDVAYDAKQLAALAHAEAGIARHGETERPELAPALKRWAA